METWINEDDGITYISCDALCVGDYGGAGSIGEANIRSLEEDESSGVYVTHGAYHHRQAWLPDTEANQGLVKMLDEEYPLIDEGMVGLVESEWEQEAWESWLKGDLLRSLPDELGEVVEDDLTDEDLFQCYQEAMERENEYPIPEYNGVCVRIDEISEAFAEIVCARLARLP